MKYLKIHTLTKGQWYDRDTILLHAAFQVLVDFMESWALETEWFEEDQRQLHRLIDVRPYLWT
jgi:hypothetical protein